MSQTFTRKKLEVAIELAPNTQTNQPNKFADTGSDTTVITDKRMTVRIQNSGAPTNSSAQVSIYGLPDSTVNQLSTLGMVLNLIGRNVLTVKAGDDSVGLTTVFRGTIVNAYLDANSAPQVPFIMDCQSALADATSNVQPTSYKGPTDVATIMGGFARQMNLGFENNGVNVQLSNPYYRGSVGQQLQLCALDANIHAEVINGNVLAIWPKYSSRTSVTNVPVIQAPPAGAMIGRPSFTQQGILVRNVFNPNVAFGARINVQTNEAALQKANGEWTVQKLDLALDSQVPKGLWEMSIYGYNTKSPNPVILPPK